MAVVAKGPGSGRPATPPKHRKPPAARGPLGLRKRSGDDGDEAAPDQVSGQAAADTDAAADLDLARPQHPSASQAPPDGIGRPTAPPWEVLAGARPPKGPRGPPKPTRTLRPGLRRSNRRPASTWTTRPGPRRSNGRHRPERTPRPSPPHSSGCPPPTRTARPSRCPSSGRPPPAGTARPGRCPSSGRPPPTPTARPGRRRSNGFPGPTRATRPGPPHNSGHPSQARTIRRPRPPSSGRRRPKPATGPGPPRSSRRHSSGHSSRPRSNGRLRLERTRLARPTPQQWLPQADAGDTRPPARPPGAAHDDTAIMSRPTPVRPTEADTGRPTQATPQADRTEDANDRRRQAAGPADRPKSGADDILPSHRPWNCPPGTATTVRR